MLFRKLLFFVHLVLVTSCCAVDCAYKHGDGDFGLFRIPTQPDDRKRRWLAAINRKKLASWTARSLVRKTFVGGRPVHHRPDHVDYIPTIFSHAVSHWPKIAEQHTSPADLNDGAVLSRFDRRQKRIEVAEAAAIAARKQTERKSYLQWASTADHSHYTLSMTLPSYDEFVSEN